MQACHPINTNLGCVVCWIISHVWSRKLHCLETEKVEICYRMQGLARCFEKQGNKLIERDVIEPVTAGTVESMAAGACIFIMAHTPCFHAQLCSHSPSPPKHGMTCDLLRTSIWIFMRGALSVCTISVRRCLACRQAAFEIAMLFVWHRPPWMCLDMFQALLR